ncbi:MAG: hypothetical protein ABIY63_18175 [Fibrobacteria bacterium]
MIKPKKNHTGRVIDGIESKKNEGRDRIKEGWKPDIDRVATYEVIKPFPGQKGPVGPQIDEKSKRYLPGGGDQVKMLVPEKDRMNYLKLVDERPIS